MDSNLDARPTGQVTVSSEPYHQGAADVAPHSAFVSTWISSPHLDSQSRDNLRQASVALDTAYQRITSLRSSINNMLNRIPEVSGTGTSPAGSANTSDSQPRHSLSHDANIRPPHSALALSGEQAVEELNLSAARLRSLISPSARQRLEDFESNSRSSARPGTARRESAWDTFSQSDRRGVDRSNLHPVPPRLRTPPMPDLVLPRARDHLDPRAAQRRDFQSANRDDASTMIGRRVAARVNASDNHGSLSSRLSFSQIEQRLQAQTAQVARELENMTEQLAATRSRRVELASARALRGDSAAAAAQDNGTSQVTLTTASGDVRLVPHPAGGRISIPARDFTLVDTPARIVLPQQISRTSSDGTPIDEPSAPARRSLSAAFREHIATYRDHVHAAAMSQDTPRNLANAPEVRGTLVNLLTRERDDQFLSARHAEYTRPGVGTSRGDDASVRSNLSSPGQGRRRRGWSELLFCASRTVSCLTHATARLNADGDEIDSDEDDNVSPHTRRLRMRFSYSTPSVEQPATRSHTVTIEDILWRTSGSDSEPDVLSPDTESCQSLFQVSPPRSPVRHPHPLPTPIEDMLIYPATKPPQRPQVVCVSKYASLAGR